MGIFSSKEKLHIITCGLDNGGKSTIINALKPTQLRNDNISATVGYTVEEFEKGKVSFTVFDMGGAKQFRQSWQGYYKNVQGVIFVIDSTDKLRLVLVREEIRMLIEHDDLRGVPILFFANKADLPGAKTPQELTDELGLSEMIVDRPYNIFASDARRGHGLEEGINWLTNRLVKS
jgi:ADP-ribosylation factor-like protein 6|eukprot:CAMPEP_0174834398 /NCGR_PEP_ID=MMETSP1114-20130205/4802_1 /TAXON_ID=312471 /ORGANISM="Neobodo designis, Strain CCAP 1951/1" /LENGTH=175 /DNA_ID=CAMNT_0016068305 /DNA_START=47 /DNA_END=574 /DNA_ORIENTATION=-